METNTRPAIQLCKFSDGGFVLHKVTLDGHRSYYSAWFNCAGVLIDADQITGGLKISRSVKRNGPAWEGLQAVGRIYFRKLDPVLVKLDADTKRNSDAALVAMERL